mmetsp:Transcript_3145/g.9082  ORF Transcript_3145/g.9082 Transcript_3145/m.9082 type:complete len:256 (-) Transcript_3145:13-780(-)
MCHRLACQSQRLGPLSRTSAGTAVSHLLHSLRRLQRQHQRPRPVPAHEQLPSLAAWRLPPPQGSPLAPGRRPQPACLPPEPLRSQRRPCGGPHQHLPWRGLRTRRRISSPLRCRCRPRPLGTLRCRCHTRSVTVSHRRVGDPTQRRAASRLFPLPLCQQAMLRVQALRQPRAEPAALQLLPLPAACAAWSPFARATLRAPLLADRSCFFILAVKVNLESSANALVYFLIQAKCSTFVTLIYSVNNVSITVIRFDS